MTDYYAWHPVTVRVTEDTHPEKFCLWLDNAKAPNGERIETVGVAMTVENAQRTIKEMNEQIDRLIKSDREEQEGK